VRGFVFVIAKEIIMINIKKTIVFLSSFSLALIISFIIADTLSVETCLANKDETINFTAVEWFEKGKTSFVSGDYKNAIDYLTKAIELDPKSSRAYYYRGIAYGKLGNDQQAIKDFDKAIELNPKYSMAYNGRGIAYGNLGDYKQAIEDYNKAIELNPKYAHAYYDRGLAYDKLGNYKQAIEDYGKAIELTQNIRWPIMAGVLPMAILATTSRQLKIITRR
jgi:tetratricopeptide (TPR) repeat protein